MRLLPDRKMGLVRNLTAGEIAGQVRVLTAALAMRDTTFNIVLMGMGEPLHNYDETMKALRILADPQGFALPPRRVTLSTVGLPAGARTVGVRARHAEPRHLAARADRSAPRRTGPAQQECTVSPRSSPRANDSRCRSAAGLRLEYVLLAGVNDSPQDARLLAKLLARVKSKVNLIPLNAAPGFRSSGRPTRR